MNVIELLIGAVAILAGILLWWLAMPRDGQVRWWLGGDAMQASYAVAVLSILAFGMANIVTGLVPG
jgi:hypothetical protein